MHSRACHPAAGTGGMWGHVVPWPGGEAARSEGAYLNGWEETGVVVPLISRMADVGRPPPRRLPSRTQRHPAWTGCMSWVSQSWVWF